MRTAFLTALSMLAFAANSLLCRAALKQTRIDAATFTTIRLVAGALTLVLVLRLRPAQSGSRRLGGNWWSALALFVYAAAFSFAYVNMPAAPGALILFGSVQATMLGYALWTGERLRAGQLAGLCLAFGGLVSLLLPGFSAPPLASALVMAGAGTAWGTYSLRGKGTGDPTANTTGNFLRSVPLTLLLGTGALLFKRISLDAPGVAYAVASGTVASGLGYILWYSVLPRLTATNAATVQLSVPVLASAGGILFLGEAPTLRLLLSSLLILGGIGLAIVSQRIRDSKS